MTLGQAIYAVLTTQFKKDAKDAHAIVEGAGYVIYKNDGHFHVKNRETRRVLFIKELYCGWALFGNYGNMLVKFDRPEKLKVDLVGYLNKPAKFEEFNPYRNNAEKLYKTLQDRKWDVEWEDREIDEIIKKMKKLQDDLVWHTERRAKARTELENIRKQYGLGRRTA